VALHDRDEPLPERAAAARSAICASTCGSGATRRTTKARRCPTATAVDPETGAATRELARDLEAAIAALPPKQRAALLLSRWTVSRIATSGKTLGISEGAVKALLFRATHALKAKLKAHM
jgi:RNA polymerase sigma-70 factor (ECF subfamily)